MKLALSAVFGFSFTTSLLAQGVFSPCFQGKKPQADIPRRSFQWPQFKGGYVEAHETGLVFPAAVDFIFPSEGSFPASERAKEELMQEVGSIEGTITPVGCVPEGVVAEVHVDVNIQNQNAALGPDMDESYQLKLEGTTVTISAATDFGARHGIVTLQNLLEIRSCNANPKFANTALGGSGGYFFLPFTSLNIDDSPRLEHRGLMLDTTRGFIPVQTLKRIFVTMGRAKLNVFHWHATDDQSFPLVMTHSAEAIHGAGGAKCYESNDNPCLGAYSNEKTYSEDQIKEIIDFARLHGVRVIIEVDMPSHARSWGSANVEMVECFDIDHQRSDICLESPCGPLSLNANYEIVLVLAKLIIDDLDELALPGEYIHVGMDEVLGGCWGEEQRDALMTSWLKDMVEYATAKGRRLIAWQDAIDQHGDNPIPESVLEQKMIPQVWLNADKGAELLERGHDLIWSNYESLYLDCGRGNIVGSWCEPYKVWWKVFAESPDLLFADITGESIGKVLGGEVCLWSEHVNELNAETLLWPRAAAWGGATWEPRTHVPFSEGDKSEVLDPQEQLRRFAYAMFRQCVPFTPMQTMWCYYGDEVGGGADGRLFCDAYAQQYL